MTKYYKTSTTKDGKCIRLYVETYPEAIDQDLEQGESGSLIRYATGGTVPPDEMGKHRALAFGSFMLHSRGPGLAPIGKISETESIPRGLESFWCGGSVDDETCAVVVYRQDAAA